MSSGIAPAQDKVLDALAKLTDKWEEMDKTIQEMRKTPAAIVREEAESEIDSEEDIEVEGARGLSVITPEKLRKDTQLMARAADRLARIRLDEETLESEIQEGRTRSQGKKSGSTMLASELVKERIDWPHLHVKRLVAGKRKCVAYGELRIEEFVFGYLRMLKSPRSIMDKDKMIDLLEWLMQDTIDYSWTNVLSFYEELGHEVEKG